MTVEVLTAVAGPAETGLVAGLARTGEVTVVRRCADLAEVVAAAEAGLARAAVLSGDLPRLDLDSVSRLLGCGVAVVGLAAPADPDAPVRLRRIGVQRVVLADAPPADVADAVVAAVAALPYDAAALAVRGRADAASDAASDAAAPGGPGPATRPPGTAAPSDDVPSHPEPPRPAPGDPPSGLPDRFSDIADALAPLPRPAVPVVPAPQPHPSSRGRVVAVWGPTGAPGRTAVAVTLAAHVAASGVPVLLADADTYGPSIAQVLGLLDESAGLAAAVRTASQGALDPARLAALAPLPCPDLRVLTGLARTARWPELRPAGLDAVWETCRSVAELTVVDCGFGLESDEELTFDTAAPRRNGATLSALAAADLVVAVGSADPVGIQRLVRGLADLADVLGPGAPPPVVVVNRVRAAAVGPKPEQQVRDALARYAGVRDVLLVPDDRAAFDAAMLAGRTLVETAPASPARHALAALAERVGVRTPSMSA